MESIRTTKFRVLTGGLRALPDFLIIGAQRSGTTSLYSYLAEHPAVAPARKKEISFFSRPDRFALGLGWYRSFFPAATYKWSKVHGTTRITGEATPEYLFFPQTAQRISKILPSAKLIVLLRNPVTRAFSDYELNVKKQREELGFEVALEKEDARTEDEWARMMADEKYFGPNVHLFSYRRRGHYAEQLERWFQHYPRERFLFLRSEDMFTRPNDIYQETLRFLGLPEWKPSGFEKLNSSRRSALDPETAAALTQYFRPHNERLYELIGRDMQWEESTFD